MALVPTSGSNEVSLRETSGKLTRHVVTWGRRTLTSKTKDGVTTTYTYDLAGQLASESRSGYSASYTFDANGNRLTKTLNGVTENYTYDDGDKMLTAGSKSYAYDTAGRTTSVTNGSNVTNLTYDFESRLATLTGPGISSSYAYNGLDTRVSKIENSVSNTFVRDGIGVTAPVIRDTDAAYTSGVSERRGGVSTFNFSGLKNAELQTSSAGAATSTRQYDAYGAVVGSTGTWSGPFGYAGDFGYQEDASGHKLLGHRYYDSSTGRFLTRDPVKDGRNWYVYCGNSPLLHTDPTGLYGFQDWWEDASAFWGGTDVVGPGGEPVRVGGWHGHFFNQSGNAMTVNGTVHLNDGDDYENYVNNDTWSKHERRHIAQVDEYYGGSSIFFVGDTIMQYIAHLSHDDAENEIDADNHSGGKPYRDPLSGDPWYKNLWDAVVDNVRNYIGI